MKSLDEIHKIMEKIYNEERKLSSVQRVKKIREESEKFLKERKIYLRCVSPKETKYVA
ncbi:MAG: hypothetical protein U9Q24_04960 [Candidatus Ratteibacteria bacterium]|nr:hypothetical protein [Candidatus Ratteibacteria bacterium]